jgi:hypothetical protein
MVPNAAVTGIGHDNNRIVPNEALLDFVDNKRCMFVTSSDIRVARTRLSEPTGLIKAYGRKRSVPDRSDHVVFIEQVFGAPRRSFGVVGKINKRLSPGSAVQHRPKKYMCSICGVAGF